MTRQRLPEPTAEQQADGSWTARNILGLEASAETEREAVRLLTLQVGQLLAEGQLAEQSADWPVVPDGGNEADCLVPRPPPANATSLSGGAFQVIHAEQLPDGSWRAWTDTGLEGTGPSEGDAKRVVLAQFQGALKRHQQ